jgi:hypothetical protein
MTNQCGIYKLNRKLAELETVYTIDKIEQYLDKFQDYGKVVISQATTEIMLTNWFKHNFNSNKKGIILVNKELKDIKDKVLLKKLYDSFSNREYPLDEIFSGIILQVNASSEAAEEIQEDNKIIAEQEGEITDSGISNEQSLSSKVPVETGYIIFVNFICCATKPYR